MSDISISISTPQAMSLDNQASGAESIGRYSNEIASGFNQGGADNMEMAVAGAEVASRTSEFFGTGTDFSSTGTDNDIQKAVGAALNEGMGTITDIMV